MQKKLKEILMKLFMRNIYVGVIWSGISIEYTRVTVFLNTYTKTMVFVRLLQRFIKLESEFRVVSRESSTEPLFWIQEFITAIIYVLVPGFSVLIKCEFINKKYISETKILVICV